MTEIKEILHEIKNSLPPLKDPGKVHSGGLTGESAGTHRILNVLAGLVGDLAREGRLTLDHADSHHPHDLTPNQVEVVLGELKDRLSNPSGLHANQRNNLLNLGITGELLESVRESLLGTSSD